MSRTVDILREVAPRAFPNYVRAFDQGDNLLGSAGINTPIRQAHFLAQVLCETGGGTVLREDMNYTHAEQILKIFGVGNHTAAITPDQATALVSHPQELAERVYGLGNPRKARELGNTRAGDGYLFRGGGVLQTTGGNNYRDKGNRAAVDFYDDPDLITDPRYTLQPALDEWTDGKLNDAADRNDITTITQVINGGLNGFDDRKQWFERVWPIASGNGTATPAWQAAAADDDIRWLQESLNHLGADPSLLVDGRNGPATIAAVKWFQGLAGVTADGIAGPVTKAAIKLRLAAT